MPARYDAILFGVSVASVAVEVFVSTPAVDVIAGLLLTLFLPGAALVATLGRRHWAGVIERQVWIVGASIGLTVLGGLALNFSGGLTRSSWLEWNGAVILVCVVLKQLRTRVMSRPESDPPTLLAEGGGVPDLIGETREEQAELGGVARSVSISFRQVVLLIAAVLICTAALMLSLHTNAASTRESFVQAWVLPRPSEDASSTSVQLGVRNHLGKRSTFLVRVDMGGGTTKLFTVKLADGASWTQLITRQPGEQVESSVASSSQPSVILSRVYLATPLS